jgi:parvulin-like peptidyl-prolyl isomerase
MIDILIEAHGVDVLQQMIILQLAKQETQKRGIRITRADVDEEFRSALDSIAASAGMNPTEATDANKREALNQMLADRGISMSEFMIGMERNAHLRKLAAGEIQITDATLREEFARTYGERVLVQHIQLEQRDTRGLNEAQGLIAKGADFGDIARQLSKNADTAARGGEMEPFTFGDPDIPAALRETAFSLKEGAVSNPVLAGQFVHILKLVRRIPAEGVKFDDVREEIERRVRERALPQAMQALAKDLFVKANIKVLDPRLREKYQDFLNSSAPGAASP